MISEKICTIWPLINFKDWNCNEILTSAKDVLLCKIDLETWILKYYFSRKQLYHMVLNNT